MTKTASRRTALAMLGLAPAAAMSVESFAGEAPEKGDLPLPAHSKDAVSNALRRLAENIDNGSVLTERVDVQSSLAGGEVMKHVLSLSFVYSPGA